MICPGCNIEGAAFHKRSHVLPDWMYEKAFSPKHKVLQLDMNGLRADKKQSGIHGSYWCNACETTSNDGDTYASLILTDKSPSAPARMAVKKQEIVAGVVDGDTFKAELWAGIDFKRFQNFVFSVVLRGELHKRCCGKGFLASDVFQELMKMYRTPQVLDDDTYPVVAFKSPEGSRYREFSFLPCVGSATTGHILFRGGGYEFHLFTSSTSKPVWVMTTRLKRDGTLPMALQAFEKTATFKSHQEKFREIGTRFPPSAFGIAVGGASPDG